jgi:hypothetical protein
MAALMTNRRIEIGIVVILILVLVSAVAGWRYEANRKGAFMADCALNGKPLHTCEALWAQINPKPLRVIVNR